MLSQNKNCTLFILLSLVFKQVPETTKSLNKYLLNKHIKKSLGSRRKVKSIAASMCAIAILNQSIMENNRLTYNHLYFSWFSFGDLFNMVRAHLARLQNGTVLSDIRVIFRDQCGYFYFNKNVPGFITFTNALLLRPS